MKRIITNTIYILCVIVAMQIKGIGQVSANLILNSRPPSYLSDWNNAMAGQLVLTNSSGAAIPVRFQTTLSDGAGNIIGSSRLATAQVYNAQAGASIFSLDKVLQLDNMNIAGSVRSLANSGRLAAGNYQLCFQLYNGIDNVPIGNEQCRTFIQVNYQLPYLLTPADKTWLDANQAQTVIAFRWSSLVPRSQETVNYQLEVYEVQEGQLPMQALRSNQPILVTTLRNTTQYFWRPNLSLKDSTGHVFVWTVKTMDEKGEPVATADANTKGRSEPRVFGVGMPIVPNVNTSTVTDARCDCPRTVKTL